MQLQRLLPAFLLLFYSNNGSGQQASDTSKLLDAVEVTAKKRLFEQKPEGIIINTQSSLLSKGSSVLELLERAPGVMIDRRNGSIIFKGKADVLVLLNGRPMRLSPEQTLALLNGMSGAEVARIELLDAPPAGYDAQGTAGVINIITGRTKKPGASGTLTITGGLGWAEKMAASLNLAHNSPYVKIYGNYSFGHDRSYSEMFITSQQDMPVFGGKLTVTVQDTTEARRQNHDALLGTDIQITKKIKVGYSLNWNHNIGSVQDITRSNFVLFPDSLLFFNGHVAGKNRWNNFLHDLYAEKQIQEGEKLMIDINYLRFNNRNPSVVTSIFQNSKGELIGSNDSLFAPRQRGSANTLIIVGVAKLDYEKRFREKWLWQSGVKLTSTRTVSASGIESLLDGNWTPRRETINNAIMHEKTIAMYGSLNLKVDSLTSLTAGLRYEYWTASVNDPVLKQNVVSRFQGGLFPSILFAKKLNRRHELQLSFSSRIGRPSYNDLASFVRYSDPTAVYAGNTLLRSSRSLQFKVALNHRSYSFSLSLGHEDNPIVRYQITESPNRNLLLIAPQNLRYQNNISLQTNLPVTVNSWWTMNYNIMADIRQIKLAHTSVPIRKTYFTYSANLNQSFILPRKFSAELSGWYNARFYNGSIKVAGMGAVNIGVKKQFNKNRGSLNLSMIDLFSTMHINTYYGTLVTEAFSITNHVAIDLESAKSPIIKLTYSRPLGRQTVTTRTKLMEEKERVQY